MAKRATISRGLATFTFAFAVLAPPPVLGVSYFDLADQRCLRSPPESVAPNQEWAGGVGNWFLSTASELHAYRTAAEVAGVSVHDLSPPDLYYKSCLRFVWGQKTVITGFGGKQSDCELRPNADGTFSFRYASLGLDGRATVVATDNESFIMFYVCWPQGREASWAVISTVPTLSERALAQVHDKARSLGFWPERFTQIKCESCR